GKNSVWFAKQIMLRNRPRSGSRSTVLCLLHHSAAPVSTHNSEDRSPTVAPGCGRAHGTKSASARYLLHPPTTYTGVSPLRDGGEIRTSHFAAHHRSDRVEDSQ